MSISHFGGIMAKYSNFQPFWILVVEVAILDFFLLFNLYHMRVLVSWQYCHNNSLIDYLLFTKDHLLRGELETYNVLANVYFAKNIFFNKS